MNHLEAKEDLLGADENCILQYLRHYPDAFITEMEITSHADGRTRFKEDKHWAHNPLTQLLELRRVDTDGFGRYQIHVSVPKSNVLVRKHLAPHLREILEHSDHKFDLSSFA